MYVMFLRGGVCANSIQTLSPLGENQVFKRHRAKKRKREILYNENCVY